jgi:hypothetical protein
LSGFYLYFARCKCLPPGGQPAPREGGTQVNKNNRLRDTAAKIGAAAGRLDGRAHKAAQKAAKAVSVAKVELAEVTKQLEALKKQVAKSSKHLQAALK